jgi:hypothetical protein
MMTEKYGFIYIWYDRKHKRYYVGCRWGHVDDGYVCSSSWMKKAYKLRPQDFKRRIIKIVLNRNDLLKEEFRYLKMIKDSELKHRYYNLNNKRGNQWWSNEQSRKTIGQKVSESKKGKKSNITPEQLVERGKKISEIKRKNAETRRATNGGKYHTEENRMKCIQNARQNKHTEEWKAANSVRMKEQWSNGTRRKNLETLNNTSI